jgi:hypothetical protein
VHERLVLSASFGSLQSARSISLQLGFEDTVSHQTSL